MIVFILTKQMNDIPQYRLFLNACLMAGILFFAACSSDSSDDGAVPGGGDGPKTETPMEPVFELTAKETKKANKLQLVWKNSTGALVIEISYVLEEENKTPTTANVRIQGEKNSNHTFKLLKYGKSHIGAIVVDSYWKRLHQSELNHQTI